MSKTPNTTCQHKRYINKDMKIKDSQITPQNLSPFFLSSTEKGSIFLKVGIFRRSRCLGRSWRRYPGVKRRTQCRKGLCVTSRKWNRPSVPIVGLVDACMEIANRSIDVLQVILNSVLHPFKICVHLQVVLAKLSKES